MFRYFIFFDFFNIMESARNRAYFVIFIFFDFLMWWKALGMELILLFFFRFFNIVSSGGSEGFRICNNTMELYIIFTRTEEWELGWSN